MRVLIIRVDHLGDLILTTPLIRSLAKAGHAVEVMARQAVLPAVQYSPYVKACWPLEKAAPQFPRHWLPLGRWLRTRRYDAILIPHGRPKELLLASACSGAPIRVTSWAGIWGRLTLHRCLRSNFHKQTDHVSRVILRCGEALGAAPDGLTPDIIVPPEAQEWAQQECRRRFSGLRLVGIHPGCAGNTCNLPASEYGRLAGMLIHHGNLALIATGTASENALLKDWPAAVVNAPRFWNTMGELDLLKLAALIQCLSLLVVTGTGPLHMASALRIATVSPFCRFPPLSAPVWGNVGGRGIAVEPPRGFCESVRTRDNRHCDFRGTVRADDLYRAACRVLKEEPNAAYYTK